MSTEVTKSYLITVVATPLWGVCIFEAASSGRRTRPGGQALPWLQRVRVYEMAFSDQLPRKAAPRGLLAVTSDEMRNQTVSSPSFRARF
jgi:hypothetical protein